MWNFLNDVVGTVASVEAISTVAGIVDGVGDVDGSDADPFAFNTSVSNCLNIKASVGP